MNVNTSFLGPVSKEKSIMAMIFDENENLLDSGVGTGVLKVLGS